MQEVAPVEIKVDEPKKEDKKQNRLLISRVLGLIRSPNKLQAVENIAYGEVNNMLKEVITNPESFQKQSAFNGFVDELEKIAVSMKMVWSRMPLGSRVYNELVGTKDILNKAWDRGQKTLVLNKVRASRGKSLLPTQTKYTPELNQRDTYRKPGLVNEPAV